MAQGSFITNTKTRTLRKRLNQLIEHSRELKFLVGFFYFSGWRELHEALKGREDLTIKVLVGLDVDRMLGRTLELAIPGDTLSNDELADRFFASMGNALNTDALDTQSFYEQVGFFLSLIEQERLQIRKTLHPNHAKLYFFKIKEDSQGLLPTDGKFITGSSNLTYAGIRGQDEFNVEIGDYGIEDAETYFDNLWNMAIPITEIPDRRQALIDFVRNRTQAALVTPFEAYVLVVKTYLDLMEQKTVKPYVLRLLERRGYKTYQYQLDAVNQALTIIEHYNGVIIADVVGLGKSVIAGMIARQLGRRGMVLCPPGLIGDKSGGSGWRKYMNDFQLYDWEVWSSGDLEGAVEYLSEYGDDIEVVIVDEAHRFRNEDTQSYELLSAICRNRIVILLTATPFNNTPSDIFALLKLMIIPGKSKITLDENLEGRFARYSSDFRRLSFITRYYNSEGRNKKRAEKYYQDIFEIAPPVDLSLVQRRANRLASEIRRVLEPVLIRRNRLDLKNDPIYRQEITELSEVADPKELFFELTPEQSQFYDEVVNDYFGEQGQFHGAIYQPFVYEKGRGLDPEKLDEAGNRAFQQQRNLFDFMRRLLVKRFESSFGAFEKSIQNFEAIHKHALEFIHSSGGRYILDRKLIEKIYEDDPDEIEEALREFAKKLEEATTKHPKHDRIYYVSSFKESEAFLRDIEADLELMKMIRERVDSLGLVEKVGGDGFIVDPKARRLVRAVESILSKKREGEPRRKVVIFTEYVDTVKYLEPLLQEAFPGRVLTVAGSLTKKLYDSLLNNFDASVPKRRKEDNFDILLTSDKLSEGVNLNRAGAIINYDIPWNPTRVIQRVGRINRIGKKLFGVLNIYNFFPTVQGADIIKSREIASQKMFLIHNTLGEDAKIFDVDETPSPSELFKRINKNPEEEKTESTLTRVRQIFHSIQEEYPEVVDRIAKFPARVKTAKASEKNQLVVFRRKALGFFIQQVEDTTQEKPEVSPLSFEESLPLIACEQEEKRLDPSPNFWPAYEAIKSHREVFRSATSELSVEVKAMNNLKTALRAYKEELSPYLPFIRTLIKDLRHYKTLPKHTLRRLASADLNKKDEKTLEKFIEELNFVRNRLGKDYLDIIIKRLGSMESEIIISVENQESMN